MSTKQLKPTPHDAKVKTNFQYIEELRDKITKQELALDKCVQALESLWQHNHGEYSTGKLVKGCRVCDRIKQALAMSYPLLTPHDATERSERVIHDPVD